MEKEKNYFIELQKIQCETSKKKDLTYISWSDAWSEVKKMYPNSNYTIYENNEGYPYWESKYGIDVKVGVTINGIEHIIRLPVMDGANKAMKDEDYFYETKRGKKKCEKATSFDINKTIMRALTKAIAMHGIGLYVYQGEDLPNIEEEKKEFTDVELDLLKKAYVDNKLKDYDTTIKQIEKKYILNENYNKIIKELLTD